ncbi:UNVERIFIED_CONTAM: hypothetical protein Sradi_3981400 [Sesamum radiatum]|uniref:Uncharacterized protein n=1 Tax=Sesamum radiatum TaxID=300843 RepID=A0AAW2PJH6_SESRA
MSLSISSSEGSTSDGVATRAGANAATCSRITVETICWIAPSMAGDNSFEEVQLYGGSTMGATTLGDGGVCAKATGVDPLAVEIGGILVTTCKA